MPDYFPLFISLVAAPFVLAAATMGGLWQWLQRQMRWPLLVTDAATAVAAWSVFLIYLFGSQLPLVLFGLAPACLLLTIGAAEFRASS